MTRLEQVGKLSGQNGKQESISLGVLYPGWSHQSRRVHHTRAQCIQSRSQVRLAIITTEKHSSWLGFQASRCMLPVCTSFRIQYVYPQPTCRFDAVCRPDRPIGVLSFYIYTDAERPTLDSPRAATCSRVSGVSSEPASDFVGPPDSDRLPRPYDSPAGHTP